LYYLIDAGFQVVGATEKAGGSIYDVDFTQPTVIVMGSEGKGISDSVLSLCNVQAAIPMSGKIGSLNVSVATAIVLFEAVRQRIPRI
jgi:23S rRNA (guanosine2251-2'-O)-methyltransferase